MPYFEVKCTRNTRISKLCFSGDAQDILDKAQQACQPYADIVSVLVLFCGPKLYNRVVEGDISIIAKKFTVERLDMTLLITLK